MHTTVKLDTHIDILLSFFISGSTVSVETLTYLFSIETESEEVAVKVRDCILQEYTTHKRKRLAYPIDIMEILSRPIIRKHNFVCRKAEKYDKNLQCIVLGNLFIVKKYNVTEINNVKYLSFFLDSFYSNTLTLAFTEEVAKSIDIIKEQLDYCLLNDSIIRIDGQEDRYTLTLEIKGVTFNYTIGLTLT